MLFLLALTLMLWTSTQFVQAQEIPYALQVGAGGDNASRGNSGMAARIRTHVYSISAADYGNSFWVGDILANGGFIQFGYQLSSPGYYCLNGETIGPQIICQGSGDTIGNNDARWFWQYWPNPNVIDFYSGVGPANSAGPDGSWHVYQILPNEANGWNFVLDGKPVSSINSFQWTPSKDPLVVVAEEVTSIASASGRLGPVEFSDLSYSKQDGWHRVESLQAISACIGANSNCNIPYGLKVLGSNHIIAGTGEQPRDNGELLWSASFLLNLSIPYGVQVFVDQTLHSSGTLRLPLTSGLHTISVPSIININDTSRLRFQNWSDGSAEPNHVMNVSSDVSLEAMYVKQSKLTIISPFPTSGDGWYDQNSTASFSTNSTPRLANNSVSLMMFDGWYDENGKLITTSRTGTMNMDSSHLIEAHWHQDFMAPVAIIIVLLSLIAALIYRRGKY